MSSVQFSFPPESFSAVYKSDGAADANVVNSDSFDPDTSPVNSEAPTTLFSCFHCAFRNSIKVIRKEKHKKDKHTSNIKVYADAGKIYSNQVLHEDYHGTLQVFISDSD